MAAVARRRRWHCLGRISCMGLVHVTATLGCCGCCGCGHRRFELRPATRRVTPGHLHGRL
jgi:hypothetical protein